MASSNARSHAAVARVSLPPAAEDCARPPQCGCQGRRWALRVDLPKVQPQVGEPDVTVATRNTLEAVEVVAFIAVAGAMATLKKSAGERAALNHKPPKKPAWKAEVENQLITRGCQRNEMFKRDQQGRPMPEPGASKHSRLCRKDTDNSHRHGRIKCRTSATYRESVWQTDNGAV